MLDNYADIIISSCERPDSFVVQYEDSTTAPLTLTKGICDRIRAELRRHPVASQARVVMDGGRIVASNLPVDGTNNGLSLLGMAIHAVLRPREVIYRDRVEELVITAQGNLEPRYC